MNCPNCGALQQIMPGMKQLVCPYCQTVLFLKHNKLETDGKKSGIMPFPTIFEVTKTYYVVEDRNSVNLLGDKLVSYMTEQEFTEANKTDFLLEFRVYGHIRLVNDGGFWDQWFLRPLKVGKDLMLDKSKDMLIEEDEGKINLYEIISEIENSSSKNIEVGTTYEGYFVQEGGIAEVEGVEGQTAFYLDDEKPLEYYKMSGKGDSLKLDRFGEIEIKSLSL